MYGLKLLLGKMLFLAVPAAIVFCCFYPYRKKALQAMKLKSSALREVGLVLFVMVIFSILALTLWPTYYWEKQGVNSVWGDLLILMERPSLTSELSLTPFSVFADYIEDLSKGPAMFFATLLNFFGNLLVFVPIGFFPVLLFRKVNWKHTLIIGFGMSLFIEVVQYFIMRNSAVDDVILNTAGAICGYFVYVLLRRWCPRFVAKFRCTEIEER